ncbi:MAG: hypothetical protein QOJ35_2471 [Solirubrobacteraceae bacterium]|nr:hypothetical protein [Solirubrobacteraceae bacterium]
MADSVVVSDAEAFLADAYDRGGRPWQCVDHARCVSGLLRALRCSDDVVAAGILHDVVADGCATLAEVRERFGDRVGDLVGCLSEDGAVADYRDRKRALRHAACGGGWPRC